MPVDAPPVAAISSYFSGTWTCSGTFSNGKAIGASIRIETDNAGSVVVVHQDDTSGGNYHALEVWSYMPASKSFASAIFDPFSGMRTFASPGWSGDGLTWTSDAHVKPLQQFVYTKKDANAFALDWKVSRDGTTFVTGDSMTCTRKPPA